MSESNTHPQNPYPRGQGVGSVPVLFSLRNVQPNIVGGISKSTNDISNATKLSEQRTPTTATNADAAFIATVATPSSSITATAPVKPASKGNQLYNAAVVLLVLALCLLVIRNAQGPKPVSNGSIASSNASVRPNVPTFSDSNGAKPPLSISKSNDVKPNDSWPSPASSPVLSISTSTPVSMEVTQQVQPKPAMVPPLLSIPTQVALEKLEPASKSSKDPQPSAQPDIRFPELSSRIEINGSGQNNPSVVRPQSTNDISAAMNTGKQTLPIANNESGLKSESGYSPVLNPVGDSLDIVDTSAPIMTTRELIAIHERGKQNSMQTSASRTALGDSVTPSLPASVVSNVYGPIGSEKVPTTNPQLPNETNNSLMMSGRPYPSSPREYQPLPIPAYEQRALRIQGAAGLMSPSQLTRQPASNGSNRYPESFISQPTTTPVPYAPLAPLAAPPQGSNSVGYPPGN